jgi:hypothetical protein
MKFTFTLIVILFIITIYSNHINAYPNNCGLASECCENYAKKNVLQIKQCEQVGSFFLTVGINCKFIDDKNNEKMIPFLYENNCVENNF